MLEINGNRIILLDHVFEHFIRKSIDVWWEKSKSFIAFELHLIWTCSKSCHASIASLLHPNKYVCWERVDDFFHYPFWFWSSLHVNKEKPAPRVRSNKINFNKLNEHQNLRAPSSISVQWFNLYGQIYMNSKQRT